MPKEYFFRLKEGQAEIIEPDFLDLFVHKLRSPTRDLLMVLSVSGRGIIPVSIRTRERRNLSDLGVSISISEDSQFSYQWEEKDFQLMRRRGYEQYNPDNPKSFSWAGGVDIAQIE
jgi:hypothetical protein